MKTISRYIMTLALLLTAVTGAWATTDVYLVGNGDGNWLNGVGWDPGAAGNKMTEQNGVYSITFTNVAANSELQFKFAINGTWDENYGCTSDTENELNKTLSNIELFGTNIMFGLTETADVTISFNLSEMTYMISTKGMKVGDDTPAGPTVAWTASTKTGTFEMPGSDVVLTPIYAKAAAFATTGAEPEVKPQLPEAAEGVIAGTDASLIAEGTGIVAFAGTSAEVKQGTLMYAIGTSATQAPALTDFSATVPTAAGYDDGAEVYVWYYIKGADAPEGQQATEENTFNDTEPTCLTVTVLTNKFNIQFNAANANTIEAGKATVTVGGTAAPVTEGKLQGVKMGSEVKLKAKEGYKFRKVEVKKKASESLIVNPVVGQIIGSDGKNYNVADVPTGVEKVAMIAYVGSETGHDTYKSGLAIALRDEGEMDWATAKSTCEAKSTFTNAAWMVPSVPQWMAMCTATGNSGNAYYGSMKYAMIAAAGEESSFKEDDYQYWSSSENSSSTAFYLGLKDDSTSITSADKNNIKGVRAVLAF